MQVGAIWLMVCGLVLCLIGLAFRKKAFGKVMMAVGLAAVVIAGLDRGF